PVGVCGSSATNRTVAGTLYAGSSFAQCARTSAAVTVAPTVGTTTAPTVVTPSSSSSRAPTTATSATCVNSAITSSTSWGYTLNPRTTRTSAARSAKCNTPFASKYPTSPVRDQPSTSGPNSPSGQ